jgi:hypothetical protein
MTVIKYSANGSFVWERRLGITSESRATRIVVDDYNQVIVTGYRMMPGGNYGFLTVAMDTAGVKQWEKSYATPQGHCRADHLLINGDYIYVSGTYENQSVKQYITIAYGNFRYNLPPELHPTSSGQAWFYEQQGQLLNDTAGTAGVAYYSLSRYPSSFINWDRVSFVWQKLHNDSAVADTLHRIDLQFENANHRAEVYGLKESEHYHNYYLAHCPQGITNLRGNAYVAIKELYRNIDLYYTHNSAGLRMLWVAAPGTKPSIQFRMEGASAYEVDSTSGELIIHSSLGSLIYKQAYAYEIDALGNLIPGSDFAMPYSMDSTGVIGLYSAGHNLSNGLVVVMEREEVQVQLQSNGNLWWSTFIGGTEDDMALDIVTSPDNDSFVGGLTYSTNFPLVSGIGYQNQNIGLSDGFLMLFDNNAIHKWTTYYGGVQNDQIQSLAFNHALHGSGEALYALGTSSSSNLSIQGNASGGKYFKDNISGGKDAFIARFNELNGELIWSSFIGGEGDEDGRSIALDNDGNVYVAGNTNSNQAQANGCLATSGNNFPLCDPGNNAYYQNTHKGNGDIFITSFDSDNKLRWSTFYGSDEEDLVFEIHFGNPVVSRSNNDNLILVGSTEKISDDAISYNGSIPANGNFPLCDIGGSTDFFQVSSGGIISRFNSDGVLTWATNVSNTMAFHTVSGTDSEIIVAGIADGEGTNSCSPVSGNYLPICNSGGSFNQADGQLYMMKFNKSSLSLQWSSLYGGFVNLLDPQTYMGMGSQPPQKLPYTKLLDVATDWANNFYIFGSHMDFGFPTFATQSSQPAGMYYQSLFSGGLGDLPDAVILNFNEDNQRVWATFFGTAAGSSSNISTHPLYVDVASSITCYQTKDLYIAGYAGQMNLQFPFQNPGPQPGGIPYFSTGHNYPNNWDAFVARFDLQSVGVSIKEDEYTTLANFVFFPNPTDQTLNFKWNENFIGSLEIFNSLGKQIKHHSINLKTNELFTIDVSELPPGIYLIKAGNNQQQFTQKFIKK